MKKKLAVLAILSGSVLAINNLNKDGKLDNVKKSSKRYLERLKENFSEFIDELKEECDKQCKGCCSKK